MVSRYYLVMGQAGMKRLLPHLDTRIVVMERVELLVVACPVLVPQLLHRASVARVPRGQVRVTEATRRQVLPAHMHTQ